MSFEKENLTQDVNLNNKISLSPELSKTKDYPILYAYLKSAIISEKKKHPEVYITTPTPFGSFDLKEFNIKNSAPEVRLALENFSLHKQNKINSNLINYNFNKDLNLINSISIGNTSFNNPDLSAINLKSESIRNNWYLTADLQKLFITYFKNIYTLVSNVKYKLTPNKLTLEFFYFITIPNYNYFIWYNILFNNFAHNKIETLRKYRDSLTKLYKNKNKKILSETIKELKKRNKIMRILKKKNNKLGKRGINLNLLNLNNIGVVYKDKFKTLITLLSNIFNKSIEIDLIRLHHSDSESNILSQLFLLILKRRNARRIINKLFFKKKVRDISKINYQNQIDLRNIKDSKGEISNSNFIPVYISGLYFYIGGRLMREPIIPRISSKKLEKGAISKGKINNLNQTQLTRKNTKGAFTLKVSLAQNLF